MDKFQIIILFIAVISIGAFLLLKNKMKPGFGNFNLKVYGITLIAILTTILSVSNIESSNLSPVYGLFGSIAGYLFGLKKE